MPSNDREVFDHLTATGNEYGAHIDLLTYANFAAEKKEWMLLFESKNERPPDQSEIDGWISGVSEYQFNRMRSAAIDFFAEAAESYLQDRMKEHKAEIMTSTVISEVKAANVWWKQLSFALITALISPILLGLILVGTGAYARLVPTAQDVAKWMDQRPAPISGANAPAIGPPN